MSELRVDNIVDMGGSGAPQLRKGASVTGISTITQAVVGNATINAGGINATGIVTSSSNKFVGDFASGNITAGVMTATSSVVASNITINSGGVNASGIVSATSYAGSGANLTGVGLSIAPLSYLPDVSTSDAALTGIGLTFNQRVFAGTGNVTLSLVSVGSTLVENFGVGSSVTYNNDADPPNITITPSSSLTVGQRYAISYPSGAFIKNTGAGSSFVGTAYTFTARGYNYELWAWGNNYQGQLGQNEGGNKDYSSPVQIPGTTWVEPYQTYYRSSNSIIGKTDGTLWAWGTNANGKLGLNQAHALNLSSPTQIPGTTWDGENVTRGHNNGAAIRTDGTLWVWGADNSGQLGLNGPEQNRSSPTQVPGTTWSRVSVNEETFLALKTDGTLWTWGAGDHGGLGQNNLTERSSPTQIPGTNWRSIASLYRGGLATRTDGTLWVWGYNYYGGLGINQGNNSHRSSPTQIPGTNWSEVASAGYACASVTKTDGTLWSWGYNTRGQLGQNNRTTYSSPKQVPGTTWSKLSMSETAIGATKTDGTLWAWGRNDNYGQLAQNNVVSYSSPVQIPGTTWNKVAAYDQGFTAFKKI